LPVGRGSRIGPAAQAAGQAPAVRPRRRPGIPGHHGTRQDGLPGAAHLCPVRGRLGHRHSVLRHGLRARPHHDRPDDSRGDAARPPAHLRVADRRAGAASHYRLARARPGRPRAPGLHRWTQQYRASETEKIESMERLIPWLPAHIPPGDETALVHGDFRLGNVIIHPTEPRVVAVLDWELSTLGHPLADLAYYCLPYRFTREWEG